MSIQQSLNSITGSVAGAIGAMKIGNAAKALSAEKVKEAKADKSYSDGLNSILGQTMEENPELIKDPEMFNKALDTMEVKREMMMAQREATRQYRNSFVKGSKEYNEIEAEGQKRRTKNFEDFRQELRDIVKKNKPQQVLGNTTTRKGIKRRVK